MHFLPLHSFAVDVRAKLCSQLEFIQREHLNYSICMAFQQSRSLLVSIFFLSSTYTDVYYACKSIQVKQTDIHQSSTCADMCLVRRAATNCMQKRRSQQPLCNAARTGCEITLPRRSMTNSALTAHLTT